MKTLNDVLDGLPDDRRQSIERRVKELIAEEAASYAKPLAAAVLLKAAVNESTNECDCDSHGHAEDCPACSPARWLVDQQMEIERLRSGLQLIADDKNRLMNEVARQTAASILGGKPIGEVPEWPTREEAEKRAAELMTIGRDTLAAADSAPDVTCATHGCTYRDGKCIRCWGRDAHSKAIDSLLDDCATVYGGPIQPLDYFEEGIADALGYYNKKRVDMPGFNDSERCAMSGIKYEKLTGKDLIAALRGGAAGDLLEDAGYAAADEIERLRAALKSVGDDYPGSSCQQWCYEQAGISLSESPTVPHWFCAECRAKEQATRRTGTNAP